MTRRLPEMWKGQFTRFLCTQLEPNNPHYLVRIVILLSDGMSNLASALCRRDRHRHGGIVVPCLERKTRQVKKLKLSRSFLFASREISCNFPA